MLEVAILITLVGSVGTVIGLIGMLSERQPGSKSSG